jgi:hypothetical protein
VVAYLTNRPKHSEEKVPVMAKEMLAEKVSE